MIKAGSGKEEISNRGGLEVEDRTRTSSFDDLEVDGVEEGADELAF